MARGRGFVRRTRARRRKGDWFGAAVNSGFTNAAAGTNSTITLLSAFDEPVTVVRMVGSIIIVPQANVLMLANWAISSEIDGVPQVALDPQTSTGVTKGNIMMWKTIYVNATGTGAGLNNYPDCSHVDVRVKRKMNPESLIRLNILSSVAYSFCVNIRAYVLLA